VDDTGCTTLTADMAIGYKMIREVFTTRVVLQPARAESPARILVSYIDGPFRHLENRWTFHPAGDSSTLASPAAKPASTFAGDASPSGCQVHFFIDYEFKSRTFQLLAGAVFEKVFRKMAEAFEARADALARRQAV
jgi:coenzyme Q-binding protein COQ10